MTRLDLWDEIVGIPLELWMSVESRADLLDLFERRDAGLLHPKPETAAEHAAAHPDHATADVRSFGHADPIAIICDCGKVFDA